MVSTKINKVSGSIYYIVENIVVLSEPYIYDMLCLTLSLGVSRFAKKVFCGKTFKPCIPYQCKANNPKVNFVLNICCIPTY